MKNENPNSYSLHSYCYYKTINDDNIIGLIGYNVQKLWKQFGLDLFHIYLWDATNIQPLFSVIIIICIMTVFIVNLLTRAPVHRRRQRHRVNKNW